MTEHPQGRPVKSRRLFCLGGVGTSVRFGVHNNSLQNLRRGLIERVYYVENDSKELEPAPKPLGDAFGSLEGFRKKLHHIVGTHSQVSPQRFVEFYQGRKKTIYQQAVSSLEGMAVQRRDSFLKTFVKAEKLNITRKPDPAPRVIQPRNVRYNVEVGRFLRNFEHYLYRGIDKIWGGPTVIKGYTVEQIGNIARVAWDSFVSPVAIGFDMKRFDQHVSQAALKWEHQVYLDAFCNDEYLAKLLSWQLENKGVGYASDGFIRYSVDGCRMSGDMNTAMGNCLLSCAIVWEFFKTRGIKARLMNNGDDCVVILEKECAAVVKADMVKHWRKFGFQCELECDTDVFERIEFCQMRPVFDGSSYVMVRNPLVSLSKDSYSVGPWNSISHAKKWVNAVGLCGLSLTGGIPVLQSYYSAFVRNTKDINSSSILRDVSFASGFRELARFGRRSASKITEESRFSFYLAFGITPDQQRALESDYDAHIIDWGFLPQGKPRINQISWMLNSL